MTRKILTAAVLLALLLFVLTFMVPPHAQLRWQF
jgi:hypothetical protein